MPFNIIRGTITSVSADAIIYADTPQPFSLFKFNPELHFGIGKELSKTRQEIEPIILGTAKIVPAEQLDVKYIIHTSAPVWHRGVYNEKVLLRSCYERSFQLAVDHQCESISLPIIAYENLGYPRKLTEQTAIECIRNFLYNHDITINLLVPEKGVLILTTDTFSKIRKYISKHYVEDAKRNETEDISNALSFEENQAFSRMLSQCLTKKELTEQDICYKANMSAKVFSEILAGNTQNLTKNRAVALAVGLELSLDEIKEFIAYAGYEFTHSSESDIIVEYHIAQNNYDIVTINQMLFRFDHPLLGC